ncbi:hypothetical protein [Loigolactobacillus binensis]|uniref:WYL domain-containing protein n=1 Tax=Loigolactobacillus binensis TaxID=2559922 RepID=A0ABW3E8T6_9LACO|nr:hypothetical protein [Loigolactobacillus binensis]
MCGDHYGVWAQTPPTNFTLVLGVAAIGQFKKFHPFRLLLAYTSPFQTAAQVSGYIDVTDPQTVTAAVSWLLFLGDDCQIKVLPPLVKQQLQQRLRQYVF